MTVHRSGALTVVAGDLQTTHRGAGVAIKLVDWGTGGSPFLALLYKSAGGWAVKSLIEEFDDRSDGKPGYRFEMEAEQVGGLVNWIKQILLPKINAALRALFPPLDDGAELPPPPPPATGNVFDDLDALIIKTLRFAPQADGTLVVTA